MLDPRSSVHVVDAEICFPKAKVDNPNQNARGVTVASSARVPDLGTAKTQVKTAEVISATAAGKSQGGDANAFDARHSCHQELVRICARWRRDHNVSIVAPFALLFMGLSTVRMAKRQNMQDHVGSVANPTLIELAGALQSQMLTCNMSLIDEGVARAIQKLKPANADPDFCTRGVISWRALGAQHLLANSGVPVAHR